MVPASGSPSIVNCAQVQRPVVVGAEEGEIFGHGQAPVFPVLDVVGVEPQPLRAQRMGAALVAAGEVATQRPVGGALGRVDADELTHLVGHDLDPGVAGQVAGHGVGDDGAELELRGAVGAVGVDVDVEHDGVAFSALAGAGQGGVQGVGRLAGHADEPVGPGHVAAVDRGIVVGGVEVVAVAELGLAGGDEAEADEGALRRRGGRTRRGSSRRGRHAGAAPARAREVRPVPSACSGSDRKSRSSWETNRSGARAAISASRSSRTRRAMRTMASSPRRPSVKRAKQAGSSSTRRAICTNPWALAGDTPAFQVSQCSGERMPTPAHPSTANRSRHRRHQPSDPSVHRAHHRDGLALSEPPRHLLGRGGHGWIDDQCHASNPNDGV